MGLTSLVTLARFGLMTGIPALPGWQHENLAWSPHMAGSGGHNEPNLPRNLDTYPAHKPWDQQGRLPRTGPPTPHQQGTPNPKWEKAKHNLVNFAMSMFSSAFRERVVVSWETGVLQWVYVLPSVDPFLSPHHLGGVRYDFEGHPVVHLWQNLHEDPVSSFMWSC